MGDHKALETIFGNPFSKPSARIERWLLRLQQYDFSVVYATGSENFLSRPPPPPPPCNKVHKQNIPEDYVKFLTMAVPPTLTINDISKATARDECLWALKNIHLSNRANWNNPKLKPFKQIKNEFLIDHNHQILLRGNRESFQKKVKAR